MMTARFERLSIMDRTLLISILSGLTIFLFPQWAGASVENKTSLVFEIKNYQTIKIPEVPSVKLIADVTTNSEKVVMTGNTSPVKLAEVKVEKTVTISQSKSTPYQIPPKVTGNDRVYMHEPEIRAYLCPKLGDKCNTFIAILKAENGTHECTRDNRGLNRNGTVDVGLAQINWSPSSPYSFQQLQDCKFNLDIAMKKYDARGFRPWAAYNTGRYLKHLPAVLASANIVAETPITVAR